MEPITEWPAELIWICSCGVAAVGGVGRLLGSDQRLSIRNISHAILFHGVVGGGLAGVGFAYLGWQQKPLAMLGFSALYGGGIVSPKIIGIVAENAIGLLNKPGGSDGPDDKG
jgi:hypothetical protein